MNKALLVSLVIIILLAGCGTAAGSENGLQEVTINLTYIPNVQFAPFYVAIENGYFAEEGLKVTLQYGNEADMVALVGSDNQQFMVASGEQVLLSRAQGLPVVSVTDWYRDYPVGVTSLSAANIFSSQDLRGKVIGLPGLYGANYIGFEALAIQSGLKPTDYELRSIGFTQVEALVTNQVDAVVIYLANEPVLLASQGYEVNTFSVTDTLALVGNQLVTNEKSISERPELVHAVVNAFVKGVQRTAAEPEEAYEISKKYVENLATDETGVQFEVLKASIKLWKLEESPGIDQEERWQNMQEVLLQIGLMEQSIDVRDAYTDVFYR